MTDKKTSTRFEKTIALFSGRRHKEAATSEYPLLGKRIEEAGVTYLKGLGKGGMGIVYLGAQDLVPYILRKHPGEYTEDGLRESLAKSPLDVLITLGVKPGDNLVAPKNINWAVVSEENRESLIARFNREIEIAKILSLEKKIRCVPGFVFGPSPEQNERGEDLPLITEYAGGRTIEHLAEQKGLSREKLDIVIQIGEAIAEVHEETEIVHRDIKPDNIRYKIKGSHRYVVSEEHRKGVREYVIDAELKILDFGIGKINPFGKSNVTQEGDMLGTLLYMSPEAVNGDIITVLSDQYSLGKTLWHVISGREPHKGAVFDVMLKIVNGEGPPPLYEINSAVPKSLSDVISKSFSVNPNDRFSSVRELTEAIKETRKGIIAVYTPIKRNRPLGPAKVDSKAVTQDTPAPPRQIIIIGDERGSPTDPTIVDRKNGKSEENESPDDQGEQ